MHTLIIGQSGGPTSVINASLFGSILEARKQKDIERIYGLKNGLDGLINEQFIDLTNLDLTSLATTPGAILGSVRFKIDAYPKDKDIYEKIKQVFLKYDIKYFIYIGGNDSMDTAKKINDYFKFIDFAAYVIGVPKTVDNDLQNTYFTPGYPSSCKFIATTISEIYLDTRAYIEGRVTIIELMGRDAGWLTAASKIPSLNEENVDLIYLPEIPFDMNQFLIDVKRIYAKQRKVLVCISEGIKDENGEYILKKRIFNTKDNFGHLQLGGTALILAEMVKNNLNLPVRAIELNLPQRCSGHLLAKVDVDYAIKCGKKAVQLLIKKQSGYMVCIEKQNDKLKLGKVKLEKVATFVKPFPKEWIINNNDISQEYLNYILPLIDKEVKVEYQNGIPKHFKI